MDRDDLPAPSPAPDRRGGPKRWVEVRCGGRTVVRVRWWRIAAGLLGLLAGGWSLLPGAAYVFLREQRDFAEVSYLNLAWPPRWPAHREAFGRHLIALARRDEADGLTAEAARHYAAGLARCPDDLAARRQFGYLLMRSGRPLAGLRVLQQGLDQAATDLAYLRLAFGLMAELHEDRAAADLAAQLLPAQADAEPAHRFIALQLATARFNLGDYDGVEAVANAWDLARRVEGAVLLARMAWERGYPADAIARLDAARTLFPERDEIPLQLIRFHRALGHHDRAHSEALLRYANDPLSPGPRLDLLYSWQRRGETARAATEARRYLEDFSADPAALTILAWYAAENADVALARRLPPLFAALKLPPATGELALAQAEIAAGEYLPARARIEAALARADTAPLHRTAFEGLRALACFGAGDAAEGDLYLEAFLTRDRLRASDAVILAGRLAKVGAVHQARRLLETAVRYDALNQAALAALVRLGLDQGDPAVVQRHLPALLKMRKPSRSLLQEAYLRLGSAAPELRRAVRSAIDRLPAVPEPAP